MFCSIFTASQWGLIDRVAQLIIRGTNVDLEDAHGYTALHLAAQAGQLRVVKYLLSKGANVNAMACGATPLHRASFSGRTEVCEMLIAAGADINAADNSFGDLRTPLQKAVSEQHIDIVKLLISTGCDVNASDASGQTALDFALKDANSTRHLLIGAGAVESSQLPAKYPAATSDNPLVTYTTREKRTAQSSIESGTGRYDEAELDRLTAVGAAAASMEQEPLRGLMLVAPGKRSGGDGDHSRIVAGRGKPGDMGSEGSSSSSSSSSSKSSRGGEEGVELRLFGVRGASPKQQRPSK
jgi:hypothetical protein